MTLICWALSLNGLVILFLIFVVVKRRLVRQGLDADGVIGPRESDLLKVWEVTVETQMHFNDMIMKIRTLGLTAVSTVLGASAVVYAQHSEARIAPVGWMLTEPTPVAAFVALAGLALLLGVFVLDYGYYYGLLLGSVEAGHLLDKWAQKLHGGGFALTPTVSQMVSRGAASLAILMFYGLADAIGLGFVWALS